MCHLKWLSRPGRLVFAREGGDCILEKTLEMDLSLDLSDLEVTEVEVVDVADALGLPEMGGSVNLCGCCACCSAGCGGA